MENLKNSEIWERIKLLLKQCGKNQTELCFYCGFSLQNIRNKITRNAPPNIEEIIKISEFLNVTTDFLLTGFDKLETTNFYKSKYENLKKVIQNALNED